MNERPSAARPEPTRQFWVTVALPDAMAHADAEMLVAYLRGDMPAAYFIELTAKTTRLHAFVPRTAELRLLDLKQRVARLLLDVAEAAARASAGPRRISDRNAG